MKKIILLATMIVSLQALAEPTGSDYLSDPILSPFAISTLISNAPSIISNYLSAFIGSLTSSK